jgi:hypothetical protein
VSARRSRHLGGRSALMASGQGVGVVVGRRVLVEMAQTVWWSSNGLVEAPANVCCNCITGIEHAIDADEDDDIQW